MEIISIPGGPIIGIGSLKNVMSASIVGPSEKV
jgi:hypothetical protein